jgi:hypothetical protein
MKKHGSWIIAAALVLVFSVSAARAATDFEKEGKLLTKLTKRVACVCNLNGRMGVVIANPAYGISNYYLPACHLRTFDNATGEESTFNNCSDFDVLH